MKFDDLFLNENKKCSVTKRRRIDIQVQEMTYNIVDQRMQLTSNHSRNDFQTKLT
jgi:hypothetical protein